MVDVPEQEEIETSKASEMPMRGSLTSYRQKILPTNGSWSSSETNLLDMIGKRIDDDLKSDLMMQSS